jgi:hypothetical protein
MLRILAVALALVLPTLAVHAENPSPAPRVGDVWEILSEYATKHSDSEGGSGSSHGRNMLVERVVAVRDDGVEVEVDLPAEVPKKDRARIWQYPARILRPQKGPIQLLNRAELERRVAAWLKRAKLPREACGQWYFSWNAFQIECDPDVVIQSLAALDRWPDELREGAPYQEPGARGPAALTRKPSAPDRAVFTVEMEVDPEAVRLDRARSDAVVAEIMGKEAELRPEAEARAPERISGTVTITFETDAAGLMRRRTTVTELEIEAPDGKLENETVTDTIERRLVSRRGS